MSFGTLKAVVCDADGTLFQLKAPLARTYSEILSGFSYQLDQECFNSNLRKVWKEFEPEYLNERESYRTSPEREREVWFNFIEMICKACGIVSVTTEAKEALYSHFATAESRLVCHELLEALKEASNKGLLLYLATNNDMRVHTLVESLLPSNFFTSTFTAGELGWKKPSPNFFKEIEARTSLNHDEILHIGNDLELDVHAAEKVGWRALHFLQQEISLARQILGV